MGQKSMGRFTYTDAADAGKSSGSCVCLDSSKRLDGSIQGQEDHSVQLTNHCWLQWRQRCASQLCESHVRDALQGFVAARFNRAMERLRRGMVMNGFGSGMPADQCMHLLESYVVIGRGRKGKAYKEWLCAREERGGAKAVESGLTLLVRDVVREFLRREYGPDFMISADYSIPCANGTRLTLDELMAETPGPDDITAERELRALAADRAAHIIEDMDHREMIAVLARELGLSLADPVVLNVAGCRKSAMNDSHHKLCARIARTLKEIYRREHEDVVRRLMLVTFSELSCLVVARLRLNPVCATLFEQAELS